MKRLATLMVAVVAAEVMAATAPTIVSSQIRANDSTILDVVYKVTSDKPTVNVRALAFEDGTRSFWKVVRPETFVKDADGNETAQNIGDNIAANVEHKLSWKVSADWKTDLAKVKFEVLTSDMAQLPLKTITIPAVAGKSPSLTVAVNDQADANIFNALLWHYADAAQDLEIRDGRLYRTDGVLMSDRTNLGSANRWTLVRYLYDKMGWNDGKGGYSEHTTVGSYLPNAWGLCDMHGNVFEWCLDWYGGINGDPVTDYAGAASGSYRVQRGGCWSGSDYDARSGYRDNFYPSSRFYNYGFRLGRTLESE